MHNRPRASDSCLMLDYVRVINFRITIIIIINWLLIDKSTDLNDLCDFVVRILYKSSY